MAKLGVLRYVTGYRGLLSVTSYHIFCTSCKPPNSLGLFGYGGICEI